MVDYSNFHNDPWSVLCNYKGVIIGGYANSGKSFLINRLKSLNPKALTCSTSATVHKLAKKLAPDNDTKTPEGRSRHIDFIEGEGGLIDLFTRKGLIRAALKPYRKYAGQTNSPFLIAESIGGEELGMMVNELAFNGHGDYLILDVHSSQSQKGVDIRKRGLDSFVPGAEYPLKNEMFLWSDYFDDFSRINLTLAEYQWEQEAFYVVN